MTVTQASSIPITDKVTIARLVAEAITILDNVMALVQSTTLTGGDVAEVFESMAEAGSLIGYAGARVQSIADSEDGRTVARAIAFAQTAVGSAVALSPTIAQ